MGQRLQSSYICFAVVLMLMKNQSTASKSICTERYCFTLYEPEIGLNADTWCRSNGSKLLQIVDEDVQMSVANFIRQSGVYLNGWNILTSGKTTIGAWTRVNGKPLEQDLYVRQDNSQNYYGYLRRENDGWNINSANPSNLKSYICSGSFDCNDEFKINGTCHTSNTASISWYEARNRCVMQNGDLASFDSITSNLQFKSLNRSWLSPSSEYWIGIRKEFWTWQDPDSDLKYSHWKNGQPFYNYNPYANRLCLFTSDNSIEWTQCEYASVYSAGMYRNPFVCFSDKQSSTATTKTNAVSISSSTSTLPTASSKSMSNHFATITAIPSPYLAFSSSTLPSGAADNRNKSNAKGLSFQAKLGIGIGVGVGGFLLLVAAIIVVVIIIIRNLGLFSRRNSPKSKPPDVVHIGDGRVELNSDNNNSNHYATVASLNTRTNPDSEYLSIETKCQTIYAPVEIVPQYASAHI